MGKLTRAALLAVLPLLCGAGARDPGGATLKLRVQIESGVIKVADLWENAGAKADAVIGTAPAPGRSIVVEANQLAYIARLFDVDWHPISGVERSAVERLGRPLTHDELASSLRQSLIDAGGSPSATIEFANFSPILVPPTGFPVLSVEQLAYDPVLDRFTANLSASSDGMDTQRMRVSGRLVETVPAIVATRRLSAGDVITAGDVRIAQVPARQLASPTANELGQVIGQSPKRTVVAGQALALVDVGPPVMVPKGSSVVIAVDTQGLSLTAQGVALEAGGRDDMIQVMNPLSRAVLQARITGPGRASVAPGSAPVVSPKSLPRNPEVAE